MAGDEDRRNMMIHVSHGAPQTTILNADFSRGPTGVGPLRVELRRERGAFEQQFGDLHRIQRRTLAQVVARDHQREAVAGGRVAA